MKKWSILSNKELLIKAVNNSKYKKEVLVKMGFNTGSGNYKTLDKYLKLYNIDTSHFLTSSDSIKGKTFRKKWEFKDIFKKNSKAILTNVNKKKILLEKNLIKNQCSLCNQKEDWFGKKLSFILDHINGDNKDDRTENLRLICPNCDSTLNTYMGRNTKKSKAKKDKLQRKKLIKNQQKIEKIQTWKFKILKANIDFSKKTWGIEVSKIINKSPQYSLKWVKEHMSEYL